MIKKTREYKKYDVTLEKYIQRAIIDYLSLRRDIYFFRAGSGAIRTEKGGYFKSGKRGCPDILVLFNSRYIAIEVKSDVGKQSPEQKEAEKQIIKCGGEYHLVRSIDEVMNILKKF